MWDRSTFSSVVAAAAVLIVAGPGLAAQPPQPPTSSPLTIPRERVLTLDMLIDPVPIVVPAGGGPGVVWRREVRSRGLSGEVSDVIRIHVQLDAPVGEGFSVVVLDAAGAEIDSVRGSAAAPLKEFWSRDVVGRAAFVELRRAAAAAAAPGARLMYAYHIQPTEKQAITCCNDLMPIANAPFSVKEIGRSVARLRFMLAGMGQATCTAFMVGERLALTNQHCISNDVERQSALVDFHYNDLGSALTGVRVESIVATNAGLDYTLLKLAAAPPARTGRLHFAPASWSWPPSPQPLALVIVQHPSGEPKQASLADCQLSGPDRVPAPPTDRCGRTCTYGNLPGLDRVGVAPGDATDFGHICDTKGGSSGSPVVDADTSLVVGLHHFGFLEGSSDPVNQAIVHTRILQDILRQDTAAHAEITQPRPPQ